jgi:hypothetical protein
MQLHRWWGAERGRQNMSWWRVRKLHSSPSVKQHIRLWRLCQDVKDAKDVFFPKTYVFG